MLLFGCGFNANTSKSYLTHKILTNSDSTLQTGWYHFADSVNGYKRQLERDTIFYYIDSFAVVTANNIVTLEIYHNVYGDLGLSMKFDHVGTNAWREATRRAANKGSKLAFILDDRLMQVSEVTSEISGGVAALNRGIFTKEELHKIQKQIEN